MKKILFNLMAGVTLFTLASCEPVTDVVSETTGGTISDASQLQATVSEPFGESGFTNKVTVNCSSPVVCKWTDGIATLTSTNGVFTFMLPGEQKLTLTALTPDGKKLTKEFTVDVNSAPPLPDYLIKLCGDEAAGFEKTWTWIGGGERCWGNGDGVGVANWWGVTAPEITGQIPAGQPNDGEGATMKFGLRGYSMTKTSVGGVQATGTWLLDWTPQNTDNWGSSIPWALGKITFTNTNILFPSGPNNPDKAVWTTYGITELTTDRMVMSARTITIPYDASAGEHWWWIFVPVN